MSSRSPTVSLTGSRRSKRRSGTTSSNPPRVTEEAGGNMRAVVSVLLLTMWLIGAVANASVGEGSAQPPAATIDLTTDAGLAAVAGPWRQSDARIIDASFKAPETSGQPTGAPVMTYEIVPHAGRADFDDSSWQTIAPGALSARRGNGRVSFNWYRITLTIPKSVGAFDPPDSTVWFETRVDDYAEGGGE